MSEERRDDGKTLEERVQRLEDRLTLLINNLAKNNRYYLAALKEIAQAGAAEAEAKTRAVFQAEGNICPTCPPGCEEDCEDSM